MVAVQMERVDYIGFRKKGELLNIDSRPLHCDWLSRLIQITVACMYVLSILSAVRICRMYFAAYSTLPG